MKTKRILFFVLALSIGLFATSCNSTDENEGATIAPIEGKWGIVKVGVDNNGVETLADPPQNQSGCDHDYINLKTPNVFTPNDDGTNDCFIVGVGNDLEKCLQL